MKSISQVLATIAMLTLLSCDEQDSPLQCPATLSCTEIFVTFSYAPLDNQGEALILDAYVSRNLDNGQVYDFPANDISQRAGNYTVITDAQMGELNAQGTTIRFIGTREGEVVIEQDFLIGHDCCHIVPLEGPGVD